MDAEITTLIQLLSVLASTKSKEVSSPRFGMMKASLSGGFPGTGEYCLSWEVLPYRRHRIPKDITARKPKPSGWGYPRAQWAESGCDTDKYFKDQTSQSFYRVLPSH